MKRKTDTPRKLAALILAVCLAAGPLAGCSKEKPEDPSAPAYENASDSGQAFSGVFRGEPVPFRDDPSFEPSDKLFGWTVSGYGSYDPSAGTVRALGSRGIGTADTPGAEQPAKEYAMLILTDSGPEDAILLPTESDGDSVTHCAAPFENEADETGRRYVYYTQLHFLSDDYRQRETVLCRLDRDSGTVLRSEPLDGLYPKNERWGDFDLPFVPYFLAVDGDGDVVLADQLTAVFFSPDLNVRSRAALAPDQSEGYFKAVGRGPDGRIRCCRSFGGWRIEPLDKENGGFGEPVSMTFSSGSGPDLLFFDPTGAEYDCWFTTEKGIWGGTESDGTLRQTLLMGYENSGIVSMEYEGGADLFCPVGASAFWMYSADGGDGRRSLSVYRPAGETDPSAVTVIEIAHTVPLTAQMKAAIVRFNGSRPDARAVILDYTVPGEPYAETSLAEDMAKGAAHPDIIIGSTAQDGTLAVARKNLTADLGPWLDSGDFIDRPDVFGVVLSAFSTEDGGIWGLPTGFSLNTVAASPDFTGAKKKDDGRVGWTMEEALDWFENLPDGCEGIPYLCAEAMTGFFEGASLELADRETGRSAYESPLFLRYLTWLRTLPVTEREWLDKSRYGTAIRNSDLEEYRSYASLAEALAAARNRTGEGDAGELYLLRTTGVIPVVPFGFQSLWSVIVAETLFGTTEWLNPGYPAENGEGGNRMLLQAARVVMAAADTDCPGLCRELMKILLTCGRASDAPNEIPSLRSEYAQQTEQLENKRYRCLFAGGRIVSEDGSGSPAETEEDRNGPGIDLHPAQSFRRAEQIFDETIAPLLSRDVNGELAGILSEELSSYIKGTGILTSPERCAEKIRSRADIWLAEHR